MTFLWRSLGVALALGAGSARAAEGDLEPSFGGDGKVRVSFDLGGTPQGKADHLLDLLVQPDGKPLLFGSVDTDVLAGAGLARLTLSGALDPTFGGDGKIDFGAIGIFARAFTLLANGHIVVAARLDGGNGDPLLFRFAPNGADAPFPGSTGILKGVSLPGIANFDFAALHGLPDGGFLAAGTATVAASAGSDFLVARFDADAALVPTFGVSAGYTRMDFALDGASLDVVRGLALAADGRIAAIGSASAGDPEYGVVMLDAGGLPVGTFDADGRAVYDFDIGVVSDDRGAAGCFMPDGRLVLVGTVTDPSANQEGAGLALATPTGALSPTFGSGGRRVYGILNRTTGADVACTADGKILLAGTVYTSAATLAPTEAYVTRLTADAGNDPGFGAFFSATLVGHNASGSTGGRDDQGKGIALDSAGRIYLGFDAQFSGADHDFAAARLGGALLFADGFE